MALALPRGNSQQGYSSGILGSVPLRCTVRDTASGHGFGCCTDLPSWCLRALGRGCTGAGTKESRVHSSHSPREGTQVPPVFVDWVGACQILSLESTSGSCPGQR